MTTGKPTAPKRSLFRPQAVRSFVAGLENGVPDGSGRPLPGLFTGALVLLVVALGVWFW